jgi:AAA+ superfamily predicted ATPase
VSDLFEDVLELPDAGAERRYAGLVGLDEVKVRIEKEAEMLLKPERLEDWSRKHHAGKVIAAADKFKRRPPLLVFAGDVGTGKTTIAETFGDEVARSLDMGVRVFRLSLKSRGSGAVGEMTRLITEAFDEISTEASKARGAGHILVIDEADALAQSRALGQMHHEDRAGVNALIRGIDQATEGGLRILIVMCTNRVEALDPAIRRRAAAEFVFVRPNHEQRAAVFMIGLAGTGIDDSQIDCLAKMTGENGHPYGYTYSDLVDRVIPAAVVAAYPDRPVTFEIVQAQIESHPPTAPFASES